MPTSAGQRALFVYYRVPRAHCAEALQAITNLQLVVAQRCPGMQARLWQRDDGASPSAGDPTWMDVYEHPQGVDAQREQCLLALVQDLPHDLIGVRHLEAFVPLGVAAGHPFKPEA